MTKEIADSTDLSTKKVEAMLKGVSWANLTSNIQDWFGISSKGQIVQEGLIDTIESTVGILVENGDFTESPIPDEDPYRIINSKFVEKIFFSGIDGQFGVSKAGQQFSGNSLEQKFTMFSDEAWDSLREIGTLKVRPITFQSGTSKLSLQGKNEIDKAVNALKHYPNFRVMVKGHTSLRGDKKENKKLSYARAQTVNRYINITYGVDENRVRVVGLGSTQPLAKRSGESDRSYNYRLPRVELYLVAEEY
ncbi:OmpA family protein [Thermodesulfobacteriota bacterium]